MPCCGREGEDHHREVGSLDVVTSGERPEKTLVGEVM